MSEEKFIQERLKHEHSESLMFDKILELEQQLQTAKEENVKLNFQIKNIYKYQIRSLKSQICQLDKEKKCLYKAWNEKYNDNNTLTQQNKQMREALEKIVNLKPEYYTCASERTEIMKNMASIAQQALKGGE